MSTASGPHAIVVGSGSGGLTAAVGLGRLGRSAVMIEAAEVGGDCTNVGCVPSKSLLHLAGGGDRTPQQVLERVRYRRDRLRQREEVEFGGAPGVDFRRGRARLVAADTVEITGTDGSTETVSAPNIVIATGSRPRRLDIPGLPPDRQLTNEQIFELEQPPRHLAIVGAGAVGVELATAFVRLGSEVTLIELLPRILGGMLEDAAQVIHTSLASMGVRILTGTEVLSYDAVGDRLGLASVNGDESEEVAAVDAVLVATGRTPNSGDLGLEALGVTLDEIGRIVIDDHGRTNVPGIWACGDVSTEGGTTHAAGAWGRRILRAMVGPRIGFPARPPMPAAVFTDPEVATIGEQPSEVPGDVRRIRIEISSIDRAYTDEVDEGFLIIDVRRLTGAILGCTIVGPRAGELIGTVSLAMKAGVPLHKWSGTVWPYPTYSDSLSRAVDVHMVETLSALHKDAWRWLRGRLS